MGAGLTIAAALVGWRFWGVDGACWAASGVAFVCLIVKVGVRVADREDRISGIEKVVALREAQEAANKHLADLTRITAAILDAQPADHHDRFVTREPRTQEEWQRLSSIEWPLLHRQLVSGYGLSQQLVDKAKHSLLDAYGCVGWRPPRSDDELSALIERVRGGRGA